MRRLTLFLTAAMFAFAAPVVVPAPVQAHTITVAYSDLSIGGGGTLAPDDDKQQLANRFHQIYTSTYFRRPGAPISAWRPILGGIACPHELKLVYKLYTTTGFYWGNVAIFAWVEYGGRVYNVDFSGQTFHDGGSSSSGTAAPNEGLTYVQVPL